MKDFFKDLKTMDQKTVFKLLALLVAGVALLLLSTLFTDRKPSAPEPMAAKPAVSQADYEKKLEERLAEALSDVQGAGQVKVMITVSVGKEYVLARDVKDDTNSLLETDAQGGRRESDQSTYDSKTVIVRNSDGSEEPVVLKELEPKVLGAVIVAEGGDDVFVKDALIKAAQAVLGIEPHKVQVLKMKSKK